MAAGITAASGPTNVSAGVFSSRRKTRPWAAAEINRPSTEKEFNRVKLALARMKSSAECPWRGTELARASKRSSAILART